MILLRTFPGQIILMEKHNKKSLINSNNKFDMSRYVFNKIILLNINNYQTISKVFKRCYYYFYYLYNYNFVILYLFN